MMMCYRYGKINHGSTYAGQKTIDMQVDVYGSGEFAWHFYIEKTMHFALRCYTQRAWHYALHFNIQKTIHFLYVFIYIIYRVVLIPNYKRTYDQSDQIEK